MMPTLGQRAAAAAVLVASAGCGSLWPWHSQLSQCREESQQLIGQYRSERERAARLEAENHALGNRLAELEKRLARAHEASAEQRVARAERVAEQDSGTEQDGRASASDSQDSTAPPRADRPVDSGWRAVSRPARDE